MIPTGVAVTSVICGTTVFADAVVARIVVVLVVITGVDCGLVTVLFDSAVVKCFDFVSAVVIGVVV